MKRCQHITPSHYGIVFVEDQCCGQPATRKIVTTNGYTIWLCVKHFSMWENGEFEQHHEDRVAEIW